MESIKGKKMPIKNTPVSGPIEADDRLIVNCKTDPSFSTTNTKPAFRKGKNKFKIKKLRKTLLHNLPSLLLLLHNVRQIQSAIFYLNMKNVSFLGFGFYG